MPDAVHPPICYGEVYRLDEFKRRTGLKQHAIRSARRNGLKVRYLHGSAFVLSDDWIAYLLSQTDPDSAGKN